MEPEIVVNEKITLKLSQSKHAKMIYAVVDENREHLGKWLPWAVNDKSSADTRRFLKSCANKDILKGLFNYEIYVQDEFVGLIGFNNGNPTAQRVEIGYWLSNEHTGNGIITEACRKMIDRAYKTTKVNRIVIKAATGNEKSWAIPERLGLHFEGIERQGENNNGTFLDLRIYSMLREEWKYL